MDFREERTKALALGTPQAKERTQAERISRSSSPRLKEAKKKNCGVNNAQGEPPLPSRLGEEGRAQSVRNAEEVS